MTDHAHLAETEPKEIVLDVMALAHVVHNVLMDAEDVHPIAYSALLATWDTLVGLDPDCQQDADESIREIHAQVDAILTGNATFTIKETPNAD